MFSDIPADFLLLFFLTAAAFTDIFFRRIPNLLLLMVLLPGGFFAGPAFLVRLLTVTALFYPFFRLRLVGAGDVKLLAAVAAWSGADRFLYFLFFSFFTAAVPAVLLLRRRLLREKETPGIPSAAVRPVFLPMGPFFLAGWILTDLWQVFAQCGVTAPGGV